jgi:Tfp pilus assembly PilM family ATPase
MGIGWSNRKPNPIAIDFGSETVRLLQLSEDARPRIIGAASIRVPMSERSDPASYFHFVGQHLKGAMRGVGFKGRRAVASISSFLTYVQHVRVGKCDPDQLEQQIKLELSGRLPLDPETMVVRHVPVGDVFADGQQKQEIICLAASRESVFGCVELAKTAGLDIVGMHGEPMATLEAFGHLFRRDEDRDLSTLFVDLGATTTNAAISHGPRLVFAKTVPVGVDNFIRQFAASGNISEEQATEVWLQQAIAPVWTARRWKRSPTTCGCVWATTNRCSRGARCDGSSSRAAGRVTAGCVSGSPRPWPCRASWATRARAWRRAGRMTGSWISRVPSPAGPWRWD